MLMRQVIKLISCLLAFAGFIGSALLAKLLAYGASPKRSTEIAIKLTQFWARILLRIFGIKITSLGLIATPMSGCLFVSNHQTYLDILVLAANFPIRFVAKKEVADWPIIGLMATLAGTIFIDRNSTRQSARCAGEVSQSLQQGVSVLVFPEGTSSNGSQVLPFKPMLLLSALKANAAMQSVTLNYLSINQQPITEEALALFCWYAEMGFIKHFWNILALRRIEVSLELHSQLDVPHPPTSQELAQLAYEKVASGFIAPPKTTSTINQLKTESKKIRPGEIILSLVNHDHNYSEGVKYGET